MAAPAPQMTALQANDIARSLIVRGAPGRPPAVDMLAQIFTATYAVQPTLGTVVTVPLRNVGLVKRLIVKVVATITAGAQNLTLTKFGAANFWSNVVFTDLSNNQRINSQGWHMHAIATAKRRRVFGAAYVTDTPTGYGNNYIATMVAPSTITAGNPGTVVFYLEIPFAYTDQDLRGAIWANTTSATMQAQLTANAGMLATNAQDPSFAMYQSAGAAAGTLTSFTVTVFQNFLDQLPTDNRNAPILPLMDLSTVYSLLTTSIGLPVANQDNVFAYPNFRQYLSTCAIYDNAGVLNPGTDINYWAMQSANYTNIFKYDPITAALLTRNILGDDPPAGMYYFDHRNRPIDTQQYGNITLNMNPSAVGGSTANLVVGVEAFGIINIVTQAGSLQGGA